MSLPNAGTETLKLLAYAGEVAGRTRGIAASPSLVGVTQKAALEASAEKLTTSARNLVSAYTLRVVTESFDHRITVGYGRGVDKGFDAAVSNVSEVHRRSLPDRSTESDGYRRIFPTGAIDPFVKPTLRQDPELAADLARAIEASGSTVKAELLSILSPLRALVVTAAQSLGDGEDALSTQWNGELDARRRLVDTLWSEKRAVELTLGRSGRSLARFAFYDFSAGSSGSDGDESVPVVPAVASPNGGNS